MMSGGGAQFVIPICEDDTAVYARTRSDAVDGYECLVRLAG
jgi:hypothetical protein